MPLHQLLPHVGGTNKLIMLTYCYSFRIRIDHQQVLSLFQSSLITFYWSSNLTNEFVA